MSTILVPYAECPNCQSPVPREHYSEEWRRQRYECTVRLYCEHCERGWELIFDLLGSTMVLDSAATLTYVRRTEPIEFEYFLDRLRAQLEVAA